MTHAFRRTIMVCKIISLFSLEPATFCCLCFAAMARVSGTLQKSTDVMKLVNDTLKLPEMQRTMMEMSKGTT